MTLSKAQQTAQRIIDLDENEFILDMSDWCSANPDEVSLRDTSLTHFNECGTTFCIAGILAHKDNYPEEYMITSRFHGASKIYERFDYFTYSEVLLGLSECESVHLLWTYLFHRDWSNNLQEAKNRAKYVLENDTYDENDPELFKIVKDCLNTSWKQL